MDKRYGKMHLHLQASALASITGVLAFLGPKVDGAIDKPLIERIIAHSGYDRETCWEDARVAFLPAPDASRPEVAIITTQKQNLKTSDDYLGIFTLTSENNGRDWTPPTEQPSLTRRAKGQGLETVLCDFTPQWNRTNHKLLGLGASVEYLGSRQVSLSPGYTVFDVGTGKWGPVQLLQLPNREKFYAAAAGNIQWVEGRDGEILLPIYYQSRTTFQHNPNAPSTVAVLRCRFDGKHLQFIEMGTELTLPFGRGFVEPSLVTWRGQFWLTLRNDRRAYVSVSNDGLRFPPPKPWTFEDGSELGSYNTQQHWLRLGERLFLIYTRKGSNNDHVFRNRAPLLLAEVDQQRRCVIRSTEEIVIPEMGAELGSGFGVAQRNDQEAWICDCEGMVNGGIWGQAMLRALGVTLPSGKIATLATTAHMCAACEQFGSNNRIYVVKVRLPN